MMKIALLADIHGNLPALEAVERELERLQPDCVVLNGDLINGAPLSPEVIEFVQAKDWLVVRGNHEFYYLDWGTERAVPGCEDVTRWGQLHWLVERLTRRHGDYLATLPDERTLYFPGTQPVRVTHGVPGRNRVGFYNQQPEDKIVEEIGELNEATLVSAHTHVQIDRVVTRRDDPTDQLETMPHWDFFSGKRNGYRRRWHIVNPGSVGLPLNGDVRAQFALIEDVPDSEMPGGWRVRHQRITYDRRPTLAAYAESGMLEAGGVISRLFYWEIVTAEPEIIAFYRWAYQHDYDPDCAIADTFAAYVAATGRDEYVRARDPLVQGGG
jgi:predicted phosphodiesterase